MSGGRVPQFPGKPAQTGPEAQFAWEVQMCPILTTAEAQAVAVSNIMAEEARSAIVTSGGAPAMPPKKRSTEAVRCQGARCAFFVPIGQKGDGGCAKMMLVTTMHSQNLLLEAIALKLGAIEKNPATQAEATTPS